MDIASQNSVIGDQLFLSQLQILPSDVLNIGQQLLQGIRKQYPEGLEYMPKSGKFVQRPVNFWTVKVQPKVKSLRITVYGTPEYHVDYAELGIKRDMSSYSAFVVSHSNQLEPALHVIMNALYLKEGRK